MAWRGVSIAVTCGPGLAPGGTQQEAYLDAAVVEHALMRRDQLAQQVRVHVVASQEVLCHPERLKITCVHRGFLG
jgi:hypothetical protein